MANPKTFYRVANMFDNGEYNMSVCGDVANIQSAEIEAMKWKKANPRARYGVFKITHTGGMVLVKEVELSRA